MLIAFGSVPKDGGTFTFYRNIRPMLVDYGIDLRCVSVGKKEAGLWDPTFADDGCVLLTQDASYIKKQSMNFVSWCKANEVDIVLGINSCAILSALPHIPGNISVMSRCANSFDHGYQITISGYDRLAGIVAQTPRQVKDLTQEYGVDKKLITMITNGLDPSPFDSAAQQPRGLRADLQLGFIGRLEHNQKGVLFLPPILESLQTKGPPFQMKIAGKGVHETTLRKELGPLIENGTVVFCGALTLSEIPEFLGQIDVLLFPSQFEGCPNALLEAMMAGSVPVAWKLEGITDFILQDGKTGFVVPFKDINAFAQRIEQLHHDRQLLQVMSTAVAKDARERFSHTRMAEDYAKLFHSVMEKPPPPWTPRPWSEFRVDPAFKQSWRRFIPEPVKKMGRRGMYYLGLSKRYE